MRAIILVSVGVDRPRCKRLVEDWPDPGEPGPGQIRSRTTFTGVTNGTERNDMVRGNYAVPEESLPALGIAYQNVGVVESVAGDVAGFQVGDRVFSSSPHVAHVVQDADGLLVKLPDAVPDERAALLGMVSVCVRAVSRAGVGPGGRALVVGAGFIGQVMAQIATGLGADVAIADRDERRLSIARGIGSARQVLTAGQLQDLDEYSFDQVLDAAGAPGMETDLVRWTRRGGRVLLLAGRNQVSYDFNVGQLREISIVQSMHFEVTDLAAATDLLAGGRLRLRLEGLTDPVVPIGQCDQVYQRLLEEPNSLLATALRW